MVGRWILHGRFARLPVVSIVYVNPEFFKARAREKQRGRDDDASALADGTKTKEQLRGENTA